LLWPLRVRLAGFSRPIFGTFPRLAEGCPLRGARGDRQRTDSRTSTPRPDLKARGLQHAGLPRAEPPAGQAALRRRSHYRFRGEVVLQLIRLPRLCSPPHGFPGLTEALQPPQCLPGPAGASRGLLTLRPQAAGDASPATNRAIGRCESGLVSALLLEQPA